MAFSLSKLLGSKASDNKLDSNDSVDAIISAVENTPYGVSENNVLYAGLNELGGYYFFQTVVVGQLHIKCKTGATLMFKGKEFELQLHSDMPEFESEGSDIKGRNVTKIDFQIEESDIELLQKAELNSIQIKVKKHDIHFTKYTSADEEE